MKKHEMDKLRKLSQDLYNDDSDARLIDASEWLDDLLDTFEVEEEPVQPEPDRNIRVADFIEVTPINGKKFIAQACYVTEFHVITTHQEQYDRAICSRWFGCPMCGRRHSNDPR
jgi:hypothetical protein